MAFHPEIPDHGHRVGNGSVEINEVSGVDGTVRHGSGTVGGDAPDLGADTVDGLSFQRLRACRRSKKGGNERKRKS